MICYVFTCSSDSFWSKNWKGSEEGAIASISSIFTIKTFFLILTGVVNRLKVVLGVKSFKKVIQGFYKQYNFLDNYI